MTGGSARLRALGRLGAALLLASTAGTLAAPPAVAQPAPSRSFVVTPAGGGYTATGDTGTVYRGSLKSVGERAVADLQQLPGGGTVAFTAGTFDFGSEHFEFDDVRDVVFTGAGMTETVLRNVNSSATDTEPFDFSGALRVTIRDMTVDAGGAPRTTSDAIDLDNGNASTVENVRITGSRGRGIVFDGKNADWSSTGNTIRNCEITDVPSDGVELLAATGNLVEGCRITGARGHGIQLAKSSSGADQPNKKSSDNIIRNNVIDESGQDGINVNGGDRILIEGNRITDSADVTANRDGIRIGTGDGVSCDDNTVRSDTATDTQATKTQRYGLAITSALCNRTVVGVNDFSGNRVGAVLDLGTATQFPPPEPDTTPPTAPGGVSATAESGALVRVTWTASTDAVGVTGYHIRRDGTEVGGVGGSTLAFDDATVAPATTYAYTVVATDAAGNVSPESAPATVTTPPPAPGPVTVEPVADSYVNESSPATNYGTSTQLRIDGSPVVRSYLRFSVGGLAGPVTSATLRVWANSGSSTGYEVRGVADGTWGETTITFGNAPAPGGVVAASGPFTSGRYVAVDVTPLITGNGTYDLALTGPGSTAVSFGSRESANRPQLVVGTG